MERWFDEVRLTKRPIEEIGAAFYIREIMRNDVRINRWDLKGVFGDRYAQHLEGLEKIGILKIGMIDKSTMHLTITAPGDKKREQAKKLQRQNRQKGKRHAKEDR